MTDYPKQTEQNGALVLVAFKGNLLDLMPGRIIRADAEDPSLVIIAIDDGRVVLGSECVYTIDEDDAPPVTRENEQERRQALEREINDQIAAASESPSKADAQALGEEIAGDDWNITVHAAHGKRPQVFVGRFVGEYAKEAQA